MPVALMAGLAAACYGSHACEWLLLLARCGSPTAYAKHSWSSFVAAVRCAAAALLASPFVVFFEAVGSLVALHFGLFFEDGDFVEALSVSRCGR